MTRRVRGGSRIIPRTVTVHGDGDFADWEITIRADFPARLLLDLQSTDISRILAAVQRITVGHNLPDSEGNVATDLLDVDPYAGLIALVGKATEAMVSLPPR